MEAEKALRYEVIKSAWRPSQCGYVRTAKRFSDMDESVEWAKRNSTKPSTMCSVYEVEVKIKEDGSALWPCNHYLKTPAMFRTDKVGKLIYYKHGKDIIRDYRISKNTCNTSDTVDIQPYTFSASKEIRRHASHFEQNDKTPQRITMFCDGDLRTIHDVHESSKCWSLFDFIELYEKCMGA